MENMKSTLQGKLKITGSFCHLEKCRVATVAIDAVVTVAVND